ADCVRTRLTAARRHLSCAFPQAREGSGRKAEEVRARGRRCPAEGAEPPDGAVRPPIDALATASYSALPAWVCGNAANPGAAGRPDEVRLRRLGGGAVRVGRDRIFTSRRGNQASSGADVSRVLDRPTGTSPDL